MGDPRAKTPPAGEVTVILGNQLFDPAHLRRHGMPGTVFMAEDFGLCTYVRHHRHKLILFLASMRRYAEELWRAGFDVHYERLDGEGGLAADYESKLARFLARHPARGIRCFEIEDRPFEARLGDFARRHGLALRFEASPMFLTSRAEFAEYLAGARRPFMKTFYVQQRRRLHILIEPDGGPVGGKWSFDDENRRKLPRQVGVPPIHPPDRNEPVVREVSELVNRQFPDHVGESRDFWLPTSRMDARAWLDQFVAERLPRFGDYEDALSQRGPFLFHSVLTPLLNLGLLTPTEVIDAVLSSAEGDGLPLNSVEGFIRQVIGWREFVRGIYRNFDDRQRTTNHFGHHRRLTHAWWEGTTGLLPLDDAIKKARRWGWTHHIERLMILGNAMLLSEIEPQDAYRWFMEMYVDSSEWVMGPNVYGMGIFSDGGIFATKPYICGSNYILKMSDYPRGDWCETWDGLYWSFIDRHRADFAKNPRMAMMVRAWDRTADSRRRRLLAAAVEFKGRVTQGG